MFNNSCIQHLCHFLYVGKYEQLKNESVSLTGVDNYGHVFKQEIQAATTHVHSQPFLGTGKHICTYSLNWFYYPLAELTSTSRYNITSFVCSPVSNLYRDDPVELCGERRQLCRASPDVCVIMHLALQYLCLARYAVFAHNHIDTITPHWFILVSSKLKCDC